MPTPFNQIGTHPNDFKKAYVDTDQKQIDSTFASERFWTHASLFAELVPREPVPPT